jgi:hypothetical protein
MVEKGTAFLERNCSFDGRASERIAAILHEKLLIPLAPTHVASCVDLTKEIHVSENARQPYEKGRKLNFEFKPVPFSTFKDFYIRVVRTKMGEDYKRVEKSEETWNELSQKFFACMVYKDGIPLSGAAFQAFESTVYYAMAATDFTVPDAKYAGDFLQVSAIERFKKEYTLYVLGLLEGATEKTRNIAGFKAKFGDRYMVRGDSFPFSEYTRIDG